MSGVKTHTVLAAIVLGGCLPPPANGPTPLQIATTHKRACVAKGEVIIEKDLMHDEPCTATAIRLANLVATDEDCQAYYGDASVTVDLCGSSADGRAKDGGLDGGN